MKTKTDLTPGDPINFLARFGEHCRGILHGFDRLRFTGLLRTIQDARGMNGYLHLAGVLLKHFAQFADELTDRVRVQAKGPRHKPV